MFCGQCGNLMNQDDKYCRACGNKLNMFEKKKKMERRAKISLFLTFIPIIVNIAILFNLNSDELGLAWLIFILPISGILVMIGLILALIARNWFKSYKISNTISKLNFIQVIVMVSIWVGFNIFILINNLLNLY